MSVCAIKVILITARAGGRWTHDFQGAGARGGMPPPRTSKARAKHMLSSSRCSLKYVLPPDNESPRCSWNMMHLEREGGKGGGKLRDSPLRESEDFSVREMF